MEPVLGSRSYDVMSAIGPSPLQPGDRLPVGEHTDDYPELDQAPVAADLRASGGTAWWCRGRATTGSSIPTPWCTPIWMASDRSDRVGMRLEGRPLQHR